MLVFSTQLCSFVNYCPSNLLSGSPPPLPCVKVQNKQKRVARRGWGVLSPPIKDHILPEFNTHQTQNLQYF
jgi:hypothetical protein